MFPDWKRLNWWQWAIVSLWTVIIASDMASGRYVSVLLDAFLLWINMAFWAKDQTIEDLKAQVAGRGKTGSE